MDRLDALHAFVLAVDRGSLTAAAHALRRSSASITRAIDSLEDRVGTPLLRRTTRSLKLTEAGDRYLAVARRVLAELEEAEQATHTAISTPQGLLTVTAPVAFGSLHVQPLVADFLAAQPNVKAKVLLLDRVVGIEEEGIDVAVRIGRLPDSALLATLLGSVRRVTVASPQYLAKHGRPKVPADLARHRCIASTSLSPHDSWSFGAGGRSRAKRVRIEPVLSVNVTGAAIAAAVQGVGVTCALSYQVAPQIEAGTLVRVLGTFEPAPMPVHILRTPSSGRTAKVRAFIELAAPRLRSTLA